MYEKADAHAHLFYPGFVDTWPESCKRIQPDELTLYEALRASAGIKTLLAVGYEGMPSTVGNNEYLLGLAGKHDWIRPVLFVAEPAKLTIEQLEAWRSRRGVGISLYLFDDAVIGQLATVDERVWQWLETHRFIISINSAEPHWSAWEPILKKHALRLLLSHFAAAPARKADDTSPAQLPAGALALAKFPTVGLKISAFYSVSEPTYDYPHRGAWAYVEAARKAFGIDRLYWGSDFGPCLEYVSFPQTYALIEQMPFLTDDDRRKLFGTNLLKLIGDVK